MHRNFLLNLEKKKNKKLEDSNLILNIFIETFWVIVKTLSVEEIWVSSLYE